jgi:predicted secreted protein
MGVESFNLEKFLFADSILKRRNNKMKKILVLLAFVIILVFNMSGDQNKDGIWLSPFYENQLKVDCETAWFSEEYSPSTGYQWVFIPDNSGVYKLVDTITLHPSPPKKYVGGSGRLIWKFKGLKKGIGSAKFYQYPPGKDREPSKIITIKFRVN